MAGTKGRSGGPRTKKTKEAKLLEGTFRKDRATPNVPEPKHAAPERPDYVVGRALEIWEHLIAKLGPDWRNVLTSADSLALAATCTSFAAFEEKPSATLSQNLRGWCALFGLSPADRQRIPAVSKASDKPKMVKPRVRDY